MFQEIIDAAFYCREAYVKGLVGGTGGNTSVRVGDEVYITASGCTLGDLQPEDFIKVSLDGTYDPAAGQKPSKEMSLHCAVYKARPDIKAILHLHPTNTIAATLMLDSLEDQIPVYSQGYYVKIGHLPQVPAYLAGSGELAEATAACLRKRDCALMRNHGLIVGADTIKKTFTQTEEIEANARLHIVLNGKSALSKEQITTIEEAMQHPK